MTVTRMRSTIRQAQWLALSGALVAMGMASAVATVDCGSSPAAADAGASFDGGEDEQLAPEAGADARSGPEASGVPVSCQFVDAIAGCTTVSPDGAALSDWGGWERIPGLEPCCVVDRAVATDAAGAGLAWIPCPDEDGGCTQLANPPDPGQGPFIRSANVARDDAGIAKYLQVRWALSVDAHVTQDTIFDVSSGAVVSAIRNDGNTCFALLDVSTTRAALFIHNDREDGGSKNLVVASGAAQTLLNSPRFECVRNDWGPLTVLQGHGVSNDAIGFDTTDYTVYRTAADAGAWVATPPESATAARGLLFDIIAGPDIYASTSAYGYVREYVVHNDGTPIPYRVKTGRNLTAFASDGTTMFWIESPNVDGTPIAHDVWAAPYTNDGTALDTNARKITSLTSSPLIIQGIAAAGLYATCPTVREIAVVRLADGVVRRLISRSSSATLIFGRVVHVTPSEIWLIVASGQGGGTSNSLRRYDLGNW